jgi:arsenate reductase-like glutaredoxin family protein
MSCKKAQGFLEKNEVPVHAVTDANKEKQGRKEALALARSASKVIVAKGKKVVTLDMTKDAPDDDTLAGYVLGPTGNLRAPTLQKGKTLYVGFSEDAYRELLG